MGVRVAAVTIVYLIAIRTHGEGTWLNDEASFYLGAESLLPNPWNAWLPQGLDHLGGNGYLGLLTAIAMAAGQMDTVAFRLTNATLGALVVVASMILAWRYMGSRAALVAGLVLALWPTLILWSATFLRDTLCSFAVIAVWWTW
jgi:dolichyl-phosphate-mannose--protein O-mannosyl transferase